MKVSRILCLAVLILLTVTAKAQLYNGMPQPEAFRSVHSYSFTDNVTSGSFMLRIVDLNFYKPFVGVSYNPAGDLKAHIWNSFNFFSQRLWILPMVSLENSIKTDLATTVHIDKNKIFRINAHLFNITNGNIADVFVSTLGARLHKRLAVNAGISKMADIGFTGNARLWLYKNNWIEYRYRQGTQSLCLFFHFN